MRISLLCLWALVAFATGAAAQTPTEEAPSACQPDSSGVVDYETCAKAARPGTNAHRLALINMGTDAFQRRDYAAAVRYYDEAQPRSGRLYSDPSFHAFRAAAYQHVGRAREALEEARTALAMLQGAPSIPADVRTPLPSGFNAELVYTLILPILRNGQDAGFESALQAYRAIPAHDWMSYANKGATLEQLGDLAGALDANTQALALQPEHPGVLNNQCYILTRIGRAGEGLPFCERALQFLPQDAATRHSYASALARAGQCDRAERELAEARRLDPVATAYREPIPCAPGDARH